MKTALITGISGQDGRHLSRLLLAKGYRVIGTSRDPDRAASVLASKQGVQPEIVHLDLADDAAINALLRETSPDEVYNLAASAVGSSMWEGPAAIGDINGLAVARLLEAIRVSCISTRFCQASSSEVFGHAPESPQIESTGCSPRSPYGAAKLYAQHMVRLYRERYGMFSCSAILFNHESPIRSTDFVTRKITYTAAKISLGMSAELALGDLDSRRDWGYAGDYMNAAWMLLQHSVAADYVIATGTTHSVRDICDIAFSRLGLDYRDHTVHSSGAWRAAESVPLVGDSGLLRKSVGWKPEKGFRELIHMMVDHDLKLLKLQAADESPND